MFTIGITKGGSNPFVSELLTPCLLGVPLLIVGERLNATIVRAQQFARSFDPVYSWFETFIDGLVEEDASEDAEPLLCVDCVRSGR